eukprot:Colp12_sorted_trinity150504_noHs@31291
MMPSNLFYKDSVGTPSGIQVFVSKPPQTPNLVARDADEGSSGAMRAVQRDRVASASTFTVQEQQSATVQTPQQSSFTQAQGSGDPSPDPQESQRAAFVTPVNMSDQDAEILLTEISTTKTWPLNESESVTCAKEASVTFDPESGRVVKLNNLPVLRPGNILEAGSDRDPERPFFNRPAMQKDLFLAYNRSHTAIETFVVNSQGRARSLTARGLDRVFRQALMKIDPDFREMVLRINASRHKIYYKVMPNGTRIPLASPHLFTSKKVKKVWRQLTGVNAGPAVGSAVNSGNAQNSYARQDVRSPSEQQPVTVPPQYQHATIIGSDSSTDSEAGEFELTTSTSPRKRSASTLDDRTMKSGESKKRCTDTSRDRTASASGSAPGSTSASSTPLRDGASSNTKEQQALFDFVSSFTHQCEDDQISALVLLWPSTFNSCLPRLASYGDGPFRMHAINREGGQQIYAVVIQTEKEKPLKNMQRGVQGSSTEQFAQLITTQAQQALTTGHDMGWLCVVELANLPALIATLPGDWRPTGSLQIAGRTYVIAQQQKEKETA